MDLLKQCQQWFEQDEAQKVIDTLEAIPAEERTPELDSELAKAYIAVAHIGEREPFEKALELLAPHEEHFAEDHCWNYRIASAYYFLDEEGPERPPRRQRYPGVHRRLPPSFVPAPL